MTPEEKTSAIIAGSMLAIVVVLLAFIVGILIYAGVTDEPAHRPSEWRSTHGTN